MFLTFIVLHWDKKKNLFFSAWNMLVVFAVENQNTWGLIQIEGFFYFCRVCVTALTGILCTNINNWYDWAEYPHSWHFSILDKYKLWRPRWLITWYRWCKMFNTIAPRQDYSPRSVCKQWIIPYRAVSEMADGPVCPDSLSCLSDFGFSCTLSLVFQSLDLAME